MTIHYLVLAGGGPNGFVTYGALFQTAQANMWNIKDIKGIYGCSSGAYIGMMISLGYPWEWIDDYLINRPWEKLVGMSMINIFDIFNNRSLIADTFFRDSILPLLTGKGLLENITLEEFYNFNKIDFHMYAVNINGESMQKEDISYKTHPSLSLISALSMTMALPLLFSPVFEEEKCYIDGGFVNNFPVNDCLEQTGCNEDEILAIRYIYKGNTKTDAIVKSAPVTKIIWTILYKLACALDTTPDQKQIKNIIDCVIESTFDFPTWIKNISDTFNRKSMIDHGKVCANAFMEKIKEDAL